MSKHDETWETLQSIAAGDGAFVLRTVNGDEIAAQLLPLPDGSIGLFAADGIIEGEIITEADDDDLAWLTGGPDGKALPLPIERLA